MRKAMITIAALLAVASVTLFIIDQNKDKGVSTPYATNGQDVGGNTDDGGSGGQLDEFTGETGVVTIQSLDANSNEPIDGTTVRFISKTTGNGFERVITGGYLEEELPEGEYLLAESKQAEGYNPDSSVQNFSVSKDEPKNIVLKSTRDESNVSGGAELVNAETELGSDTIPLSAVDIDAGGGEIAPENTETLEATADSTTGDSYAAESKAESNPKTSDNSSTFKLVLLAVGTVYFVLFGILRYFKKDIKQI